MSTSTPVYVLIDETHSATVVHHNDVGSDRETQCPLLPFLHAPTRSISTVTTIKTHSKRARRRHSPASYPTPHVQASHLSDRSTCPLPSSLVATSHIILPNHLIFLTRARLRAPHYSTTTDHHSLSVVLPRC